MREYERFALIIDSEASALGSIAVRLLNLGVDLLYAADLDEAMLLAAQESQRLGAVLIPSSFEVDLVEELISRICSKLAAGPRALVVAGREREPGFVERLREHGVEWAVCEPYTDRELRFVMTAAMSTRHTGERRKHHRIPTNIETTVFMGRHRKQVVVHDLSVTGAYFATPHPFLEDSRISLEIPLPHGSVLGNGLVANAKTADKPGRPDVPEGMGVSFNSLSPESCERLQEFIEGWIDRFRL
jgi:hypothetical protein